MPRIELDTFIHAPIEACFDAARDIGLHVRLARSTSERAIAGRIHGLIAEGEWVTFSARHFGVPFQLTAHIIRFEPPFRFVDEQTHGPFKRMKHTHKFKATDAGQTRMRDLIEFECPFGFAGRIAAPVVAWHLCRFLVERADGLKVELEASGRARLSKLEE